jgi:hypothetical protein
MRKLAQRLVIYEEPGVAGACDGISSGHRRGRAFLCSKAGRFISGCELPYLFRGP